MAKDFFKRFQKIFSRSLTHQAMELRQRSLVEDVCESDKFRFLYPGECLSSSYLVPFLAKEGTSLLITPEAFIPERGPSGLTTSETRVGTYVSKQYKTCTGVKSYEGSKDVLCGCISLVKDTSVMSICEGDPQMATLSISSIVGPPLGLCHGAYVESRGLLEKWLTFMSTEQFMYSLSAGTHFHDKVVRSLLWTFGMMHTLEYHLGKVCKPLISTFRTWNIRHPDEASMSLKALPASISLPLETLCNNCDPFPVSETEDVCANASLLVEALPNYCDPCPVSVMEDLPTNTGLPMETVPNNYDPCPVSETEDPLETFIDDDGIRIAKALSEVSHETEGNLAQSIFRVSIPKNIIESMPSAPNDFVAPESVQEFSIQVRMVNINHVNLVNSCIDWLRQGPAGSTTFIGFVCKYDNDCSPCLVQLSTHQRCVLIKIPGKNILTPLLYPRVLATILSDDTIIKVGAEIHKDALALSHYLGLATNRCIKISHLSTGQKRKKGVLAIFRDLFHWGWSEKRKIRYSEWGSNQITLEQVKYAVLDAWSSRLVWARQSEMWKGDAPSFSLRNLPYQLLDYFGRSVFTAEEVFRKDKDTAIEMTGAKIEVHRNFLKLQQSNFRSRVLGLNSTVELRFKNGREPEKYNTMVRRGNKVVLDPERALQSSAKEIDIDVDMISKVFVDNSQSSDIQRQKLEDVLYFLLCTPAACPPHIIAALGCPENVGKILKPRPFDLSRTCLENCKMALNSSQSDAWQHILSNPLSAVIGPPGTGKTTLIKAVAQAWDHLADNGETLLCVAHQNVAVRHMAESMMKEGIPGVLLLISEDYYVDWHEEQYTQLKDAIVVSGPQTASGVKTWAFRNKAAVPKVILCTLAVIGSQSFYTSLMGTKVSFMIIDECSQAAEGHLVSNLICLPHLQMLSVLGDPSQLPPFGKPLQSVFDLVSGKCDVKFLHEQYRMPYCIAKFVSAEFYEGRLQTSKNFERTEHSMVAKPLLWFNIGGSPRQASGNSKSLCNLSEAQAIVKFCKEYKSRVIEEASTSGSEMRAGKLIVLTLYEGQRKLIGNLLKENDLQDIPAYNVDSFQGQEADDVLISLVVGDRGSAFAVDRNRACVLLSRAKRLMYVFGNMDAVKACKSANSARVDNIWRRLANYCEKRQWITSDDDIESVVQSLFQKDQNTNSDES